MAQTKNKKDTKTIIKETISNLLDNLEVKAEIEIEKVAEDKNSSQEPDHYKVNIKTDETGLIIGRHGETINSLQLLLGVILYKKIGSWQRIILDVGDYRKVREGSIKEMVERISKEVESTGQPVTLPDLTPYERRVVHIMLSDNPKIASESSGEGKDRRLTIKLK
ncbi:hypothetical protein COV53_04895 [Candidatus Gottesmanbacteria bacterium CG11_big_fil_rev_8_21_14_0_20_37_11]|nr:MAG: hypothetical protein COV53_04895 [Candidatus Gottesmanbacteria bacterium CG11_big_fil_rev_8_21_14_0_20_37_11]